MKDSLVSLVGAIVIGVGAGLILTSDSPPTEDSAARKGVINRGLQTPQGGQGKAPQFLDQEVLDQAIEDRLEKPLIFDEVCAQAAAQNRPLLVIVAEERPELPPLPPELMVAVLHPDDDRHRERFTEYGNPPPCALLYKIIKVGETQPEVVKFDYDNLYQQLKLVYP